MALPIAPEVRRPDQAIGFRVREVHVRKASEVAFVDDDWNTALHPRQPSRPGSLPSPSRPEPGSAPTPPPPACRTATPEARPRDSPEPRRDRPPTTTATTDAATVHATIAHSRESDVRRQAAGAGPRRRRHRIGDRGGNPYRRGGRLCSPPDTANTSSLNGSYCVPMFTSSSAGPARRSYPGVNAVRGRP